MPRDLLDRSVSSVGRKVFPATRVRVFANRVTGITYGIEPIGTHIDPWPVYGRFTEPLDAILEDGRLYDQPIRELLDALGGQQRATCGLQNAPPQHVESEASRSSFRQGGSAVPVEWKPPPED
jgi:hypothetical protein